MCKKFMVILGISLLLFYCISCDRSSLAREETSSSSTENTMPTSTPTPTLTATPRPLPTMTPTMTPTPTPTPLPAVDETASGPVWYNGYVDPRTVTYEIVTNPEDLTVLINKYNAIPDEYVPTLVLADSSKNQYLRTEADDAWDLMRAACEADTGETLYLASGYRTLDYQQELFDRAVRKKGLERACSKYAYPGRSEHNLGLALDLATVSSPTISGDFADTTAGIWLAAHAQEYGFILRYPSGKSDITGYAYEAWHYRFVGVELAQTLYDSGQTLEEYYGEIQELP